MRQYQHTFGNGGQSHGRRMTDEDLLEPIGDNAVIKGLGSALRRTGKRAFDDSAYYRKAPVTGKAKPFDGGHHNPADVPGRARHTKYESQYTTRYGGKERPKTNSELARSGVDPFGKSRFYDPEHRRQRWLGAAEAGLGAAGVAGLAYGGRGVVRTTKALRKTGVRGPDGRVGPVLGKTKEFKGVVGGKPRELGLLGGGAAAAGGAIGVNRFANSRKGHAWN